MVAQREAEVAQQEGMQQPAGGVNESRLRGEQEARVLTDMRQRRDKRASIEDVRLAGGRQQPKE